MTQKDRWRRNVIIYIHAFTNYISIIITQYFFHACNVSLYSINDCINVFIERKIVNKPKQIYRQICGRYSESKKEVDFCAIIRVDQH